MSAELTTRKFDLMKKARPYGQFNYQYLSLRIVQTFHYHQSMNSTSFDLD